MLYDTVSSLYISHVSAIKVVDDTFIVICRDEGGLPVVWSSVKGRLGTKTRPIVKHAPFGTAILFEKAVKEDSGNYTCSLTDNSQSRTFSLKVEVPMHFMDTPTVQTGREGEEVTLRCEVGGSDVSKINWLNEDGSKLAEPKFAIIGDGLYISDLTREDSKVYICQAFQTSTARLDERRIQLVVQHKPSLHNPVYAEQEEMYALLGDSITLTCEVEAEPSPHFKWIYRNSRKIGQIHRISSHKSVLELNMTETTPSEFECIASNSIGTLKKFFSLELGIQPDAPTCVKLKNATSDSLELEVEFPEVLKDIKERGMEPNFIHVQYRPEGTEEWKNLEYNITEECVVLTHLKGRTKYEIEVALRNIAGLSEYTNSTFFETSVAYTVDISSSILFIAYGLSSLHKRCWLF